MKGPALKSNPAIAADRESRGQPGAKVIPIRPKQADIEFMPEHVAASVKKPNLAMRWILWLTFLFVISAIVWAYYAKLDIVVTGEGKVVPSNQVQVVQNLEGGIVSEILVKLGDPVQKDQVIMKLDPTRFTSSMAEGKAKDDALLARITRLTAEADGSAFRAAPDLQKRSPSLVSQERSLFDSRARELRESVATLSRQFDQRQQELVEKRAKEEQVAQSLALIQKELDVTRPLVRQGAVSEVDILRLERQATDFRGELEAARLAQPRLRAAMGEIEQRMREVTARFRAEAGRELNLARAEQSALSAANVGLKDRVERTVVTAPLAGTIKQIKVMTIGGVVQPGMDLVEIVPAEDSLLVEARVSPSDIGFLRPGQEAVVKVSAYDFSVYGGYPAKLEYISADTIAPEKTNEKPESYYRIRVRTQSMRPTGADHDLAIMPGMTATVDIKTDRRTVMQYLLKPVLRAKESAMRER